MPSQVASGSTGNTDPLERELAALRQDYARTLVERVSEITAAVGSAQASPSNQVALSHARNLAHRLRGSAGSYGFDELGAYAARIEEALVNAGKLPAEAIPQLETAAALTRDALELAQAQQSGTA